MATDVTYCTTCNRVLFTKDANPETGKCVDCQAGRSTLPTYLFGPNPLRDGGSTTPAASEQPLQPAQ